MYAVSMWSHTCKWSHVRTYKLKKNTTKRYLFIHILFIHLYGIWAKRHKTFRTLACESAPLCLFYRMFVKCVSRINALYNLHSTASLLVSASVCICICVCFCCCLYCVCYSMFCPWALFYSSNWATPTNTHISYHFCEQNLEESNLLSHTNTHTWKN